MAIHGFKIIGSKSNIVYSDTNNAPAFLQVSKVSPEIETQVQSNIYPFTAWTQFNDEAAWHYGKIRSTLLKIGQDIGIMDTLIAAHASSQNITLVTNNIKHFQRVPGLDITQWLG
jgi:tRNA(fMet)-specific endonuclease VapC